MIDSLCFFLWKLHSIGPLIFLDFSLFIEDILQCALLYLTTLPPPSSSTLIPFLHNFVSLKKAIKFNCAVQKLLEAWPFTPKYKKVIMRLPLKKSEFLSYNSDQQPIAPQLGMRLCPSLLSMQGFCLTWACTGLVHAVTTAVIYLSDNPALVIFLLLVCSDSWGLEWRDVAYWVTVLGCLMFESIYTFQISNVIGKDFLPFCRLSAHSADSYLCCAITFFYIMWSNLFILGSIPHAVRVLFPKLCFHV